MLPLGQSTKMEELIARIKQYSQEVTFESLKTFIHQIDINSLDFEELVNIPDTVGDYGRNILSLHPFECVLINWPPGAESAVHYHDGLFGYVWVLEGELDNVSYRTEGDNLVEFAINKYGRNGLIPEPDGVIHKLRNNSVDKRAISLHFYYPAIESFKGMKIYDLQTGAVGALSDDAKTASWSDDDGHFDSVEENAFEFISFEQLNANKSHFICHVIPKPTADRINQMNADYFTEQSAKYDFSDFNQPKRKSYTDAIDHLVAHGIGMQEHIKKHLDIASGTGRRALHIQEVTQKEYELVGVDISEGMCKIAEERGVRTYLQDWANDDSHIGEYFDTITFLYAFGHIATENLRIKTLKKIASYLTQDGVFYVDIFSLKNKNEWGALATKAFEEKDLGRYGYQKGDVFYRKRGFDEIAFLHYFSLEEIDTLLTKCGFKIVDIHYVGYAKNPGEQVSSETEGNIFIAAKKR